MDHTHSLMDVQNIPKCIPSVYIQFEMNFETTSYLLKEQFLGKTTFLET